MKYSNFNLNKQQENLRQGIQLLLLSRNEIYETIKNRNWIHSKRISNRTFRKMVQRLRTNPSYAFSSSGPNYFLMLIFFPVEANKWDRKIGAEKTFLLGSYFLLFAMHWYFVFRTLLMFSICEQMLFFFIILQLLCTFLHSKC